VPIQHIHPDDTDGNSTCNPAVLDFLKKQQQIENSHNVWQEIEKKNIKK
jgi:hypothetical protein